MINKIDLWQLACEKSPDAIAITGKDGKFIYANQSWCKLIGYSCAELRQKTWQEVTKLEDIASDQSEINAILNDEKEDYYLEKRYITKSGKEITVSLYVHRYPDFGDLQCFIIFAKPITSKEYETLKEKFSDLNNAVRLLQQNVVANEAIAQQMKIVEEKLAQNKDLAKLALEKNNVNIKNITGDYSGNKAERDIIQGSNINNSNVLLFCLLTFLSTIVLFFIILLISGFLKF